jgi:hypothetical protein
LKIKELLVNEIRLLLTNDRPTVVAGAYEHLFPATNPPWRFAQRLNVTEPAEAARDASALVLSAAPHGSRVGGRTQAAVALWVVLANAKEGEDAAFNHWYDSRHIHDTLAVPGFISGHRYTVMTAPASRERSQWRYMTLYEIELPRAAETLAEVKARAGGPTMPNPGYLAPGAIALAFQPLA